MDIKGLRRDYANHGLDIHELAPDPLDQFRVWFKQACDAGLLEPNAMVLGTVAADGGPATRVLLLKAFDARGFTFFTNFKSAKGLALEAHPRGSLTFPWVDLERQIHLRGAIEAVSREETLAYFHSRPRGSQLGAWASLQSQPIADRATLERQFAQAEALYEGKDIPLPPQWGGLRLVPESFEFWQGRSSRLHDRFSYTKEGDGWKITRLQP